MAQKLLKAKKQKIAPKKDATDGASRGIVLVGTYREGQLAWIKKNGVYNYPVKDGDEFDAEAFAKIRELWLYAGSKGERHCFATEFVGKMTRDEFLSAYPTYAKLSVLIKSENREYYVFKTSFLEYGPKIEDPIVVARGADFGGRSAKVKKVIKAFRDGGEFGSLADYLPTELAHVPRERLRVCEAAMQMEFMCVMYSVRPFPSTAPLDYIPGAVRRNPSAEIDRPATENGHPYRLGEFFCGPGGLACGALSASIENPNFRIEHAWSNDYDQETHNYKGDAA